MRRRAFLGGVGVASSAALAGCSARFGSRTAAPTMTPAPVPDDPTPEPTQTPEPTTTRTPHHPPGGYALSTYAAGTKSTDLVFGVTTAKADYDDAGPALVTVALTNATDRVLTFDFGWRAPFPCLRSGNRPGLVLARPADMPVHGFVARHQFEGWFADRQGDRYEWPDGHQVRELAPGASLVGTYAVYFDDEHDPYPFPGTVHPFTATLKRLDDGEIAEYVDCTFRARIDATAGVATPE